MEPTAKASPRQPPGAEPWSFGKWLHFHLFVHATRPGGSSSIAGREPWTPQTFAGKIGKDPSVVRRWLKDEHVPSDIRPIQHALFGNSTDYEDWRGALNEAAIKGRQRTRSLVPRRESAQGDEKLPEWPPVEEKEGADDDSTGVHAIPVEVPVIEDTNTTPVENPVREPIPAADERLKIGLEPKSELSVSQEAKTQYLRTESVASGLVFRSETHASRDERSGQVGGAARNGFAIGVGWFRHFFASYVPTALWIGTGAALALASLMLVTVFYYSVSGDPLEIAIGYNGMVLSPFVLACVGAVLGRLAQKRRRKRAASAKPDS